MCEVVRIVSSYAITTYTNGGVLSLMNKPKICPWSDVFTTYKKTENKIFVILYWYLFNRPDYQRAIAKAIEKNFRDFPKSTADSQLIGGYLAKMERFNLISRIDIENRKLFGIADTHRRRIYYQALSFLYLDPFCIKTPHSQGKYIADHLKEYREYVKQLGVDEKMDLMYAFNRSIDLSVVPLQKIFQKFSPEPEEFLMKIVENGMDFMTLYRLILESMRDTLNLLNLVARQERGGRILIFDLRQGHFLPADDHVHVTDVLSTLGSLDRDKIQKAIDKEELSIDKPCFIEWLMQEYEIKERNAGRVLESATEKWFVNCLIRNLMAQKPAEENFWGIFLTI